MSKYILLIISALLFSAPSLANDVATLSEEFQSEIAAIVTENDFQFESTAKDVLEGIYGTWLFQDDGDLSLVMVLISGLSALAALGGVVALTWMFTTGLATSAMNGSAMIGDKKVATWYVARIAIAYALILPVAGGVSSFHALMGKTILPASSALADAAAHVVIEASKGNGGFGNFNPAIGLDNQLLLTAALACSVEGMSYDDYKQYGEIKFSHINPNDSTISDIKDIGVMVSGAKTEEITNGNFKSAADYAKPKFNSNYAPSEYRFGDRRHCGKISYPNLRTLVEDDLNKRQIVSNMIYNAAVAGGIKYTIEFTAELGTLMQHYMNSDREFTPVSGFSGKEIPDFSIMEKKSFADKGDDPDIQIIEDFVKEYGKIIVKYNKELYEAMRKEIYNTKEIQSKLDELLIDRDWIALGYQYYDLRLVNNILNTTYLEFNKPGYITQDDVNYKCSLIDWNFSIADCIFGGDKSSQHREATMIMGVFIDNLTFNNGKNVEVDRFLASNKCDSITCERDHNSGGMSKLFFDILIGNNFLANSSGNLTGSINGGSATDGSITTLEMISERMGESLITVQSILMGLKFALAALIGLFDTVGFSVKVELTRLAADQVSNLASVVTTQSIFFKYIIPMMPIIVWMMAVAGYFILSIETMIAAPFAMMLMLMPEGEGLSGQRLNNFIAIMLSVILKPIFLVAGFASYLIFNGVAATYFLLPIWNVLNQFGDNLIGLFSLIAIFMLALYQMQVLCLTLIISTPNYILELISSYRRDYGEAQAAQGVYSGAQGLKEATAKGLGSMRDAKMKADRDAGDEANRASISKG